MNTIALLILGIIAGEMLDADVMLVLAALDATTIGLGVLLARIMAEVSRRE